MSLWAGVLAGPAVWLMLLQFNYTASYVACETRQTWFLHVAVAVAVAAVAAAGYFCWHAGHPSSIGRSEATLPLSDETRVQRSNFMRIAGVTLCAWFILVILAMEIPIIVLNECQ